MSQTPTFETHTEPTTDGFGRPAFATVVTMDGKPVFSFVTENRNGRADGYDHVVCGVGVRERDEYGFGTDVRSNGTPTSGTIYYEQEPTVEDVLATRMDSLAYSRGAALVYYGAKGAAIPEDERPAFYDGVKTASQQSGRRVRSGRLTGEPRRH